METCNFSVFTYTQFSFCFSFRQIKSSISFMMMVIHDTQTRSMPHSQSGKFFLFSIFCVARLKRKMKIYTFYEFNKFKIFIDAGSSSLGSARRVWGWEFRIYDVLSNLVGGIAKRKSKDKGKAENTKKIRRMENFILI